MMELLRCVLAYTAAEELGKKEWDFKTAYVLHELKRELKPHVEFFAEKERELVETYGKKDENGKVRLSAGGGFEAESAETAAEYEQKKKELGTLKAGVEWKERKAKAPERIKPVFLEALEGFIHFEEGEEE